MPSLLACSALECVERRRGIRAASGSGHRGKIIKRTVALRRRRSEARGIIHLQKHSPPALLHFPPRMNLCYFEVFPPSPRRHVLAVRFRCCSRYVTLSAKVSDMVYRSSYLRRVSFIVRFQIFLLIMHPFARRNFARAGLYLSFHE